MMTQDANENVLSGMGEGYDECKICEQQNYYVRSKIYPCHNKECKLYQETVNDICNNCIRLLQKQQIQCPFCKQNSLLLNPFAEFQDNFIRSFSIGLLSTKYVMTKSEPVKKEDASKIDALRLGKFINLPVIAFKFALVGDEIRKIPFRHILSPTGTQTLEVSTEFFEAGNQAKLQEQQAELQHTKGCLDMLNSVCNNSIIRCGTNQILITGGYYQDLDFIYGIEYQGQTYRFQEQMNYIWKQYQLGQIEQDVLVSSIYQIQEGFRQMKCQKNREITAAQFEIPFHYPYLSNTYLINLKQEKQYKDFSVTANQFLHQSRAFHQTVVTEDKIFVMGGICNGFILDSIEVAQIERDVSSKIIQIHEFQEVGSMNSPRANFSALYKPALQCTALNCQLLRAKYLKLREERKDKGFCVKCLKELSKPEAQSCGDKGGCQPVVCKKDSCPNKEYIYIAGGQSLFGQVQQKFTLERYNFRTQECETIEISDKKNILNSYIGMTLGQWENDLFIFGGVPKNKTEFSNNNKSYFIRLYPGEVAGHEYNWGMDIISNSLAPTFLPQFTVSVPYPNISNNEDQDTIMKKCKTYRLFVFFQKQDHEFQFFNHYIFKYFDEEKKKDVIMLTEQKQSLVTDFKIINNEWAQKGYFDGQSFILLNQS